MRVYSKKNKNKSEFLIKVDNTRFNNFYPPKIIFWYHEIYNRSLLKISHMNQNKLQKLYITALPISSKNIFYIKSAKKFVPGNGNTYSQIVFIGEAPGANEEIQGIPFCGQSGKLLRLYLAKYNFSNQNSFITNVVKFRPPQNRKPTQLEIGIHGKLLKEELAIIKPKIIIPIGATATEFILQKKITLTQVRGEIIMQKDIIIYPLFHPAYILRNKNLLPLFENDIHNLQKICIEHKIVF